MGENITLTEPAARIALFIGKSKYLLLLFKIRTNNVNIFSQACQSYNYLVISVLQKDRFCKVLVVRWLCDSCTCEKYLQNNSVFFKGC